MKGGDCENLLPPAYTYCWIRESFATFSARCIFSQVLPTFTTREMIPSNIPREANKRCGRMKYSLCFPYVQYSSTLIVQLCFLYWLSCFFLSYGLFARQYIVFDVCIFKKKKKDDYICVLLVPLSGSVGWTCLSAAILEGFSCSAPGQDDPLETLPSSLEGHFTYMVEYNHFSHKL